MHNAFSEAGCEFRIAGKLFLEFRSILHPLYWAEVIPLIKLNVAVGAMSSSAAISKSCFAVSPCPSSIIREFQQRALQIMHVFVDHLLSSVSFPRSSPVVSPSDLSKCVLHRLPPRLSTRQTSPRASNGAARSYCRDLHRMAPPTDAENDLNAGVCHNARFLDPSARTRMVSKSKS